MKLERRHGLLGVAIVGTALVVAALAPSHAESAAYQGVGNENIPTALQGDWEKVSYPALDRLIRQRADEARARQKAGQPRSQVTLAQR